MHPIPDFSDYELDMVHEAISAYVDQLHEHVSDGMMQESILLAERINELTGMVSSSSG